MENYVPSRTCPCVRCKWNGLMGPALLVTLGVLMLLDNLNAGSFHRTWPAILIVIGTVKVLQSIGSTAGHGLAPGSAPVISGPAQVNHE